MASLYPLSSLPLITSEDLDDPYPFPTPPDILQLEADTINVLEARVSITTFALEYQQRIKDFYRFSATRQNSKSHNIAQMTSDTLDII